MLRYLLAAIDSLRQARPAAKALGLTRSENKRFRRKVRNQAWCYLGFCKDLSIASIRKSVTAAVCCVAYDVLTDWRGFSTSNRECLKDLLERLVGTDLAAIAVDLYRKEECDELTDDGLERGYDAIVFVSELLESRAMLERTFDLRRLGLACQVVDDTLDLEEDLAGNDVNCLMTPRWREHLEFMRNELTFDRMRPLYSKSIILRLAVERAIKKAEDLLRRGLPSLAHRQWQGASLKAASVASAEETAGSRG